VSRGSKEKPLVIFANLIALNTLVYLSPLPPLLPLDKEAIAQLKLVVAYYGQINEPIEVRRSG
jgi:hypothetical protein